MRVILLRQSAGIYQGTLTRATRSNRPFPSNCRQFRVKCKDTDELFKKEKSQRFGAIRKVATRKLTMLEAATVLEDLKSPPGNRLEGLVSDRAGQHSIRVNDQFRICFVWTDTGPTDVEITNHYA
jgi:proteic killer suppression protein